MSFGLSVGNMFLHAVLTSSSLNRSASVFKPILSIISCIMILMKIRELEVVSSSFILMEPRMTQEMASFANICPKKTCDVVELVHLVMVNGVVVVIKCLLDTFHPHTIESGESFSLPDHRKSSKNIPVSNTR